MTRRLLITCLTVALVATGLAVTAAPSGAGTGGSLTIYSGRSEELIQPLIDQFVEDTGIQVDVRYGETADLALLLDEEGDQSPADVFISQSPGATGYLEGNDRLAKLDKSTLKLVAARFQSEKGRWVGVSGRVRVLAYNTDLVEEADLPDSVLDLTKAKYEGQIGVAPTNGSFQDFVTAMRELEGEKRTKKWLDGLAANDPTTFASNSAIVEAIGRGELAMGLVNHYYAALAKAADPDVPVENHVFPNRDVGSVILATAAAVLQSSDNRDEAQQFVEYLLSDAAQQHLADDEFEYPLAKEVEPPADLPPLSDIDAPELDLTKLGGGLLRTRELIAESGLEQA